MKINKPEVVISRWVNGRRVEQVIPQKESGFHVCGDGKHEFCRHNDGDTILRGHIITDVYFYPILNKVVIYTRKGEILKEKL